MKLLLSQLKKLNLLKMLKILSYQWMPLRFLFSTWAEETDEATNIEDSVSDIEKCTVEKVAVVAKGEAGKDFKTDTNTQMKQYPNLDLRWIWDVTSMENIYL